MKKAIKKFSQSAISFDFPALLAPQLESWKRFWSQQLPSLFSDIFPVLDHTGKRWKLDFLNCYLDKPNYPSCWEAVERGESYTAPLKASFRLIDLKTKKDRKSTRLNSSHTDISRMPSSA